MFVAIYDNEVIVYETNLSAFYTKFKDIEPDIKSYAYYSQMFKDQNIIMIRGYGKEYVWQKIF